MDLCVEDFQQVLENIKNGSVNINERKYNGYALIHTAVLNNQFEVVKMLIEKEADLDVQAQGWKLRESPLHLAIYKGHDEIAKILLENGAEPNVAVDGVTPLHLLLKKTNFCHRKA